MSAVDDRLEILIGKLLDGELSPAEQRRLDREVMQNPRASELLEQWRALHECSREAIARDAFEGAADPQAVFERAWQQSGGGLWRRVVRADGSLRFAVGLAAGLILGLALHFALVGDSQVSVPMDTPRVARDTVDTGDQSADWPVLERRNPNQITREVEWYGFTDRAGNQWLIEGFREGVATPAAYHGDL